MKCLVAAIVLIFVEAFLLVLPWVATAAHAEDIYVSGCTSPDEVVADMIKSDPTTKMTALDPKAYTDAYNKIPPISNQEPPDGLMVGESPDHPDMVAMFYFLKEAQCHGLALRMVSFLSKKTHEHIIEMMGGI